MSLGVPENPIDWRFSPPFDAGGCHGLQLELQVVCNLGEVLGLQNFHKT